MLQFQAVAQNPTCGTPTNLAISNIGAASAKATWTAVAGAIYYRVNVVQAGTTQTTYYSSSQTNLTMSYLNPSTAYSATVAAVCSGSQVSAPSAPVTFSTTINASCGTPQNVTATNGAGTSIQFAWTAVAGAQSYRIKLSNSSSTVTSTYSTAATSYTVTNLQANTTYTYNVSAVCGNIPGAASANATISTPTITCGTPSAATVSNISYNSARLDWPALAGTNYYKIEYKETSAANYITTSTSSLFYNFFSLKPNTSYTYRISSVCSGVTGTPTATATFTTTTAPACNAPSGISVSNITANTARMTWTAVPGVSSYRISLLKAGATTPQTYSTSSTFYNFSYLDANTTFTYTVSSFCGGIVGTPSASNTFTTLPAPACPAPIDVTVTNITSFTATVSWSVIPGAGSYRITRTGGGSTLTYSTSGLSYNVISLTPNTTYSFTVSSVCANVVGTPSAPVSMTTLTAPACNPPSNVTVSNVNVQKATISWTPIAGVTYYKIQLQAANATTPVTYGSSTSSLTLSTLLANTTYTYAVASTCGSTTNVSAYSAPQTFTTLQAGPCNAPTNVAVNSITAFTANVTWDSVPGVTYWKVQVVPTGTISTAFSISYNKTFKVSNLLPGTAYDVNVTAVCPVSVNSSPGSTTFSTPQAVVCPDNNEPNNAIATATPLTVGTYSTGAISVAGDLDYFSFATTGNEPNMKITLTNLPKDYDLKIYNSTGTQVGYSLKGSTMDEIIKLNGLPVGTYYAHVFGFANAFTPYVCYSIKAEISSAPFTLAPTGGNNSSNSLNSDESARISFNVFPNPVQNEATIDFSAKMQGKVNVAIMDLVGRTIKTYDFNVSAADTRFNVDLSELQNGMYMMNVNNGTNQKSAKLVVNK
jgi:hypothetical protein